MKTQTCLRCGRLFIAMNPGRKICFRCKTQADADVHLAAMAFAKEIGREYRIDDARRTMERLRGRITE